MDFSTGFNGDGLQPKENEALYSTILEAKPEIVLEIGTRRGGGSTYFITSALRENGSGILNTVEVDPNCYKEAESFYKDAHPELAPFLKLHLGKSHEVFPELLKGVEKIDVLFLDGEENSDQTMLEYEMLEPKLKLNSYLVCHDWNIGKMFKLKPFLLSDPRWDLKVEFNDTMTGFAVLKRK